MVRVFVALELSDEIKQRLGEAQEILRHSGARLTWVDPKNIHITLKFLGEVEDNKIPVIMNSLASIAGKPFSVRAGAVTVNNPKRPFTVWCAIHDGGAGERLLQEIEKALSPLGFEPEKRRFTPHATLARVKQFHPSLFESLKTVSFKEYGGCTIAGMKLKKSTLTPKGPVYEDLLEVIW